MPRVLEYIHELKAGGLTLRVWAKVDSTFTDEEREDQWHQLVNLFAEAAGNKGAVVSLIEGIAALDFVNAVELKSTEDGSGVLIYPDWP